MPRNKRTRGDDDDSDYEEPPKKKRRGTSKQKARPGKQKAPAPRQKAPPPKQKAPPPKQKPPATTASKKKGKNDRPLGKSTGAALPTDQEIHDRIRALGAKLDVASGPITSVGDVSGHRTSPFFTTIEKDPEGQLESHAFSDLYHRVWKGMDEILSTAATREFMAGHFDAPPTSKKQQDYARTLYENLSRESRVPTHLVGFATATEAMQHPTSLAKAVFANPRSTASAHTWFDRERKLVALEAGEAEGVQKGATKETVVKAMLRAAIVFTLNFGMAPASASDVNPFGQQTAGIEPVDLIDLVFEREQLKRRAVGLGATQKPPDPNETGRGRLTQPWNTPGKNVREVSQERLTQTKELFPDPKPAAAAAVATASTTPILAPVPGPVFPPAAPANLPDFPPTTTTTTTTPSASDQFPQASKAGQVTQHVEPMDLVDLVLL